MITNRLWSLRNSVDFVLRQYFPWSLNTAVIGPTAQDVKAAQEVETFLELFTWPDAKTPRETIRIVDVGCRNFYLAPILDRMFRNRGYCPRIDGVELDAYRRLRNLRTRKAYGDYFASSVPQAKFHACNFLDWKEEAELIFLLNPFVLERSLLAWGLPLKYLQPKQIVEHCVRRLTAGGRLLLSTPSVKEMSVVSEIVESFGMERLQAGNWKASSKTTQKQSRFGALFRKPV